MEIPKVFYAPQIIIKTRAHSPAGFLLLIPTQNEQEAFNLV